MTPEQRKQALDASKDHDLAIAIRALNEAPTDAHLHQIINDLEAALDEAGAPAGPLVERVKGLGADAARLDYLIVNRAYVVSDPDARPGHWLHFVDKETGQVWVQSSEHPTPRAAIDAARTQQEGE